MAGGDGLAQDALQESWIIVLDKLYQYHGAAPACGWVAAIVRHEALHGVRRRAREVPLERAEEPADPSGTEMDALRAELRRLLLEAIDGLPPTYREIREAAGLQERTTEEVSRQLHISRRNVATRLHRAHRLLRSRPTAR